MPSENETLRPFRMLAAIDFSACSRLALRTAIDLFQGRRLEIFLLHVLDKRLIDECVKYCSADEADPRKPFFTDAKQKLEALMEELQAFAVHPIVCQGVPFHEINLQAEKFDVDVIVIGSCGMTGDPQAIFFGGTTERVVRFIRRPVLCIPPNQGRRKTAG